MNKQAIKLDFFKKGVQAHQKYSGSDDGCYYCPICANPFTRADLENGKLTLEHIPPKSQGGKGVALTCSSCNHKSGYTIDAEVANREEVLKASALVTQKGKFDGDVALIFGSGSSKPLNFRLVVEDNKVRFYPKQKHNPPNAERVMRDFFKEHNQKPQDTTSSIKFSTRRKYKSKFANIGYLKSAYLVCFATFGYTYAFNKNIEPIRRQIVNPDEDILKGYIVRLNADIFERNTLMLLEHPIIGLAVLFNDTAIVLPLPSFITEFDIYSFLMSTYSEANKFDFTGARIEWPRSLLLKWDFKQNMKITKG